MKHRKTQFFTVFASSALIALFWAGVPTNAQTTPARDQYDNDTTRSELAQFDRFLDSHREIAEQLRKDPALVNDRDFVKNHPALQSYLEEHRGVREELRENPNAFMRQENRFDRRDDPRDNDTTRAELAGFDRFLDSHREIAEQVRKNPSLVNNQAFVENHPALLAYLHDHPAVRDELRENPNAFMRQENRFDANEDRRDRDSARSEQARFDRFLDDHREIADQVRRNPSLVNDDQYAKNHPELQAYLQDHPDIRQEARENPDSFMREGTREGMRQDDRRDDRHDDYDRREQSGDRDASRNRAANFHEFLGDHRDIAEKLSHDPSLGRSREFRENHPEFQDYLKTHPDVDHELTNNPQSFVKSSWPSTSDDPGGKMPSASPKAYH